MEIINYSKIYDQPSVQAFLIRNIVSKITRFSFKLQQKGIRHCFSIFILIFFCPNNPYLELNSWHFRECIQYSTAEINVILLSNRNMENDIQMNIAMRQVFG